MIDAATVVRAVRRDNSLCRLKVRGTTTTRDHFRPVDQSIHRHANQLRHPPEPDDVDVRNLVHQSRGRPHEFRRWCQREVSTRQSEVRSTLGRRLRQQQEFFFRVGRCR